MAFDCDQWRYELTLNRLRDFIDPDTDRPWNDEIMLLFIRNAFPDSNSGRVSIYSHRDLFGRKKFDQIPISPDSSNNGTPSSKTSGSQRYTRQRAAVYLRATIVTPLCI